MYTNISQIDHLKNGSSPLSQLTRNMSGALVRAQAERDIKNARAAAEAAIRMRSSFLENMNHELRTPLNAIIGFATMLQERDTYKLSADQENTYYEYILQSADLLLGHINTILEVSALDNGSVEPDHSCVNPVDLINDAVASVEVQAQAANVSIFTGTDEINQGARVRSEKINLIWADAERAGQALDHLLQTAIKSCVTQGRKSGKIYVRLSSRREGWVEIQIRDDGHGFPADELEQACNAFGELHRGLSKPFTGPSVGIAIAKTFIEMQGGQFTIKSRTEKGTLSTIAFPLADANQLEKFNDQQEDLECLMEKSVS